MSETNPQTVIRSELADRSGEGVAAVTRRAQRDHRDLIEARSGVDLHDVVVPAGVHRARAARVRPKDEQVVIVREVGQLNPQPTALLGWDAEAPDLPLLQPAPKSPGPALSQV